MAKKYVGMEEVQNILENAGQRVDFIHTKSLAVELKPLILHIRCDDAHGESHFHEKGKSDAEPKYP